MTAHLRFASASLGRAPLLVALQANAHQSSSGQAVAEIPPPKRSSLSSMFERGPGGRCSFSGNTCTIFGATGMVGTALLARIVKTGTQLIVPYRRDPYDSRHLWVSGELGQVYYIPYFLKDDDALRRAVKYSNLVVNLIGADYETKNFSFHDLHVDAARRIAKISREMGVQHLVHFSALNANVEPKECYIPGGSQFLKTKALGEKAVREEFPNAVIIRPADIYCPNDRFINVFMNMLRRQFYFAIGLHAFGEETYKAPVWLSDVISGTMRTLFDPTTAGETFEFVGPYSYQLGNLVEWMFELNSRGREHGFRREGYGILFTIKTIVAEVYSRVFRCQPTWNWEYVERVVQINHRWEIFINFSAQREFQETISDVLTGCKTLENLGIVPQPFEEKSLTALEVYDFAGSYRTCKEELVHPEPPIRYELMRTKDAAPKPIERRLKRTTQAVAFA
ncbi:NADH ubiquinone oxidoreductase NDUFA9:39 kDa [Trichuris trichiura]|uniref:NADH dehydrogenase [ubiquinone] 1 alpha subcomplex subunit 9, mitochondrial n=1 Tax=Trichuris trichiura TaxID=36087 RepID=A0A077ZI07_TRITR|nr:NADH ubiquinone oxidoreductase NDUFA9:39 kDa [Trichuris trichiura]